MLSYSNVTAVSYRIARTSVFSYGFGPADSVFEPERIWILDFEVTLLSSMKDIKILLICWMWVGLNRDCDMEMYVGLFVQNQKLMNSSRVFGLLLYRLTAYLNYLSICPNVSRQPV